MLTLADKDQLVLELAIYYGCDPRLFRPMELATLERARRVTQMHATWILDPRG